MLTSVSFTGFISNVSESSQHGLAIFESPQQTISSGHLQIKILLIWWIEFFLYKKKQMCIQFIKFFIIYNIWTIICTIYILIVYNLFFSID